MPALIADETSDGLLARRSPASPESRPKDALDEDERILETQRFRVVLAIGMPLWVLTGLLDWVTATWSAPQPVWRLLVLRAMPLVPGVLAYLRLRSPTPLGPRMLQIVTFACFVLPAFAQSLSALFYWGIRSPYGHGVLCVIVAYSTVMPRSWRASWPFYLALLLVFPGTMAIDAWAGDPLIRAQFASPPERMQFVQLVLAALVAVVLSLGAGNLHARLRREMLESRQRSRYRLVRKLGEGGMGEVWCAIHPGLGREVALKILRESGNADAVARFAREIKATAALTHPNTVRILDCGITDENLWYYTMELLEGQTLAALVAAGPLQPARAVYLALQAARAIAEAHRGGILHRDVKPENIFVSSQGGERDVVKVLDFGIAGLVRSNQHLTREGMLVGTLRWMSPEQELGLPADVRSDVYGLGAVLYFMLTGKPPVDGVNLKALIKAREHDGIPLASTFNPAVSAPLDGLVASCLASSPSARFADAGMLARALWELGLHHEYRP